MSSTAPKGWRAWWAHAFAVEKYDESSLSGEEKAMLTRVALEIQRRGMTTPAILWVQANRHMNWIGSQMLVGLKPIMELADPFLQFLSRFGLYFSPEEMPILISAFEKRYSVEYLLQRLEAAQAGELVEPTDSPIIVVEEAEE
jgi:hypothetical protein